MTLVKPENNNRIGDWSQHLDSCRNRTWSKKCRETSPWLLSDLWGLVRVLLMLSEPSAGVLFILPHLPKSISLFFHRNTLRESGRRRPWRLVIDEWSDYVTAALRAACGEVALIGLERWWWWRGVEGYSVLFIHYRSFSVGCAASCDICFLSNHISTFCVARLKEICPKAFRIRSGALKYMAIPIGWSESWF